MYTFDVKNIHPDYMYLCQRGMLRLYLYIKNMYSYLRAVMQNIMLTNILNEVALIVKHGKICLTSKTYLSCLTFSQPV